MTEDEAEEAFARINATLRDYGLAWLADQIAGEAAEGRASTKIYPFKSMQRWHSMVPLPSRENERLSSLTFGR